MRTYRAKSEEFALIGNFITLYIFPRVQ